MDNPRLLWALVGGAVWTCWYVYGEVLLLRKYRTSAPGALLALEWGSAILTASVLTVCAALPPLGSTGRYVAVAGVAALALVPLAVALAVTPQSPARRVVCVFRVSMYGPALAAVPWALATYPPRMAALIFVWATAAVWLAWGLGLGLWRASAANVVGACATLACAIASICGLWGLQLASLLVMFAASWFVRYEPKPRSCQ